ncbi:hypothetical protein BBP40_009210 [Aspergillus hancockii]|nr:hypothetical protein BBP40_009210 [Aspergillus hancockii]
MRAAAQLASGASLRQQPARILAFACELCTPNVRQYLVNAEQCADPDQISIAGALFSDAAAAFVLCNEYAMAEDERSTPVFQLIEWGSALIPDTIEHMGFYADTDGFRTILTRDIPKTTKKAIRPMFKKLLPSYQKQVLQREVGGDKGEGPGPLGVSDFDWALHPGGQAIIDNAKEVLHLTEEQLQSSREIYRTRGNSSSPTILVVLDRIREFEAQHLQKLAEENVDGLTSLQGKLNDLRADLKLQSIDCDVRRVLQSVLDIPGQAPVEARILQSMAHASTHQREFQLDEAHFQTFRWILDESQSHEPCRRPFNQWLREETGVSISPENLELGSSP